MLAADVVSSVDVPSFDRSNVDGFAVIAEDTFGASEESPRRVRLGDEEIHTGVVPRTVIDPGTAVSIATGGMVPRGADAVVMVEHADVCERELRVTKAVTAGSGVSFAGTDITCGETVLRAGQVLTSRDTGVLAAIGVASVEVWKKPVVAIVSTGDEIIAPGEPMAPAKVYDSNAQILADAVRELGGEAWRLGIAGDDIAALRAKLQQALESADIVLLSGGTSKGAGDLSYRVAAELTDPWHRRSRRRAQAGQADLPRRASRPSGRRPSGLSHVGDLHVPRVRRAGASDPGGPRPGPTNRRAGEAGGEGHERNRPDRVPACRPGRDGGSDEPTGSRSRPIRWDKGPAASPRSAAPTAS